MRFVIEFRISFFDPEHEITYLLVDYYAVA